MCVRSACLREANFPDTLTRWKGRALQQYGGDTLLGEIARQLGWSQQQHDTSIHVNVDLQGISPQLLAGSFAAQRMAIETVLVRAPGGF